MSHQEEMRKAFIADIAANPEDLACRLIFADWFDDNGDPERAEFIRVQIEMWGPVALSEHRMDYLKRRERELADAVGYSYSARNISLWAGEGMFRLKDYGISWKWRCGFIEEIHGPLESLTKHLPRIVQEHPILVVRATDVEPSEWSRSRFPWRWYREESDFDAEPTGVIPDEVFLCLPDDDVGSSANRCRYMEWKTEGAAHAALSKALLKLARSKVVSPEAPA